MESLDDFSEPEEIETPPQPERFETVQNLGYFLLFTSVAAISVIRSVPNVCMYIGKEAVNEVFEYFNKKK